jgi:hypothetical protein
MAGAQSSLVHHPCIIEETFLQGGIIVLLDASGLPEDSDSAETDESELEDSPWRRRIEGGGDRHGGSGEAPILYECTFIFYMCGNSCVQWILFFVTFV